MRLMSEPRVLLLDEPDARRSTSGRGAETPDSSRGWPGRALAVILVSSELPEVLGLSAPACWC